MRRVPARIALRLLHSSGYGVTPATLRQWVKRGHITRKGRGYDMAEILSYLDRRDARDEESEPVAG